MSHTEIPNPAPPRGVYPAKQLLLANARLAEAREAERNAYLYVHVSIAALTGAVALVAWAIWA